MVSLYYETTFVIMSAYELQSGERGMKESRRNYVVVLVTMIIMSVLCYRAFYFPTGMFAKRRVALYAGLVFLVVAVPILACKIRWTNQMISTAITNTIELGHAIRNNYKKILMVVGIYVVGAVILYPVTSGLCAVSGVLMNSHRYMVALCIWTVFYTCVLMRRQAYIRAELLTFLIIMIMGSCAILVTPRIPGTVPDDETHYRRTSEVIGFFTGSIYAAEEQTLREYVGNVQGHLYYDEQSAGGYLNSLESSYDKREIILYNVDKLSYYHIAYIPPACGIMLGRALGLSFSHTFMLGKWFICLTYAGLVYASIKRIRRGKAAFAAIGMIPSMVFLASAYNYDYWIMGWTMLGFAKFVALFENDEAIKDSQLVDIVVTILIGILPKIVYFPLLFPLLFLPKNRLSKRQIIVMRGLCVLVVVGVCGMLLYPILTSPGAYADTRGVGTISTSDQLQYILSDPMKYIKLLFTFGQEYFSCGTLGVNLQNFFYVGQGRYWGITLVVIVLAVFLDRDSESRVTMPVRMASVLGALMGYVLAATAMYLGFTEVGSDTIQGVQSRYVYPLLLPLFYMLAPNSVEIIKKREQWMLVLVLLMSIPMIWNLNTVCVSLY